MTLKLVIFDIDGTLVDSQRMIVQCMTAGFAVLDLPAPPRPDVLGIVGLSLPVAVARLAPQLSAGDHARIVAAYRTAFSTAQPDAGLPLYPGARDALDRLAQDPSLLLAVATGKSRKGLNRLLDFHGLAGRFVTTQVADDHPSKPHPSMIEACLRATGVAADHAVMLGDTTYDMDMAQAAGVAGIGVGWGYHPVAQLQAAGAWRILDHFDALPDTLHELWNAAA